MARVKRVDARLVSPVVQEDLRRRVVAAVVDQGRRQEDVAEWFSVSVRSVSRWVNVFRRKGNRGLAARKRGQRPGAQKALDAKMQARIKKIVRHSNPAQETLAGLCWTRKQVKELIFVKFGVTLSRVSVGKYLRSWGLSPQKPIRKAYEQNPEAVRAWLVETYPRIVAQAKADGGVVMWLDQAGLRSDNAVGITWGDLGSTPVVPKTGRRFGVNTMCAMTNKGELYFTVYEGSLTNAIMIDFCDRLVRTVGSKVHLLVDGHPTHRSKAVTAWLAENTDNIQVHFIPGYSPELNPVELLNGDTKREVAQTNPRDVSELAAETRKHLRRRQNQPGFIRSLWRTFD